MYLFDGEVGGIASDTKDHVAGVVLDFIYMGAWQHSQGSGQWWWMFLSLASIVWQRGCSGLLV